MNVVDTNVLIYAVDPLSEHHSRSRRWLDDEIGSGRAVLLPWIALVGFLRLTTNASTAVAPLEFEFAASVVRKWLSRPNVRTPYPDDRHLDRMSELLATPGTGGNLVNDAHIAAIALQHEATVITFDNDFGRFPGVKWQQPA